jgi:hypothetical protein
MRFRVLMDIYAINASKLIPPHTEPFMVSVRLYYVGYAQNTNMHNNICSVVLRQAIVTLYLG